MHNKPKQFLVATESCAAAPPPSHKDRLNDRPNPLIDRSASVQTLSPKPQETRITTIYRMSFPNYNNNCASCTVSHAMTYIIEIPGYHIYVDLYKLYVARVFIHIYYKQKKELIVHI